MPAAALLAGALLGSGCGDGTGAEGKSGARAAAEQYVQALKDGDGESACGLLTEGAVTQLEDEAGEPCPRALSAAFGAAGDAQLEGLEVVEVNASAGIATATIRGGPSGKVTSQLMREQGEWRLASPGGG